MPQFTKTIDELFPSSSARPLDPPNEARLRGATPDDAADAQRFAAETGVPAQVIERNLPAVRQRSELGDFEKFLMDNPETIALGDDFNVVAKDDVGVLGRIRKTLWSGALGVGSGMLSMTGGLARAAEDKFSVGGFANTDDGWRYLGPTEYKAFLDQRRVEGKTGDLGDFFLFAGSRGADRAESNARGADIPAFQDVKDAEGIVDTLLQFGEFGSLTTLQSLPFMVTAAANLPASALGISGNILETRREANGGELQEGDIAAAAAGGILSSAFERYGADRVLGQFKNLGSSAWRRIVTAIVAEGATEAVQEGGIEYFAENVGINPIDLEEALARAQAGAAGGVFGGGSIRSGVEVIGAGVRAINDRAADADTANTNADGLKELAQLIEASKLRERSPEQFKRFVDAVQPDMELYVDPGDLTEALEQSELDPPPQEVLDRIEESSEANTPVRLTVAEFGTYFSDTADFLSSRVRFGAADAMNVEEAKAIDEEFAERAERVIQEAENTEELRTQAQQINDQIRAQITSTGRFRDDVATAYSSMIEDFFVTMAARVGMTPLELFEQYPIRVQATDVTTDDSLDQLADEEFEIDRSEDGEQFVIRGGENDAARMEVDDITEQMFHPTLQIKLSEVSEDMRGQGIGQQLVRQAHQLAASAGKRLVSDRAVSVKQLRVYEALRRKGWTIEYTHPELVQRALDGDFHPNVFGGPAGVSSPDFQPVVRRIEPPSPATIERQEALHQRSLRPVAALAEDATDKPPAGFQRFRHFGNIRTPVIDPSFMGTGARGEERLRAGPRVTALYPNTGFQRETGVGPVEYVVDIPKSQLYDASADPEDFLSLASTSTAFTVDDDGNFIPAGEQRVDFDEFEQLIQEAGFIGYVTPKAEGNLKGQARIFEPLPVIGGEEDVLFQLEPGQEPDEWEYVSPYLSDEERDGVTRATAQQLVDTFNDIPSAASFAEAAEAGRAARGWYARATQAIRAVFGDTDAPRFAGLLAAMSPQTSVQKNLENAVKVWAAWDAAGRPVDPVEVPEIITNALAPAKVLPNWVDNSVAALTAEDSTAIAFSKESPKVKAFARNLQGSVNDVTNDTWMMRFALWNRRLNIRRGKRYEALSARVREAADVVSARTGEPWTPAQVQETVWSWTKTAFELADAAGETRTIEQLVADGEITDARVAAVPALGQMIADNATVIEILEAAGYGEQIKALEDVGLVAEDSGEARATPGLLSVAQKLDAFRQGQEEVLEQSARLPGLGDVSSTYLNIGLATNDGTGITPEQIEAAFSDIGVKMTRGAVRQSGTEPTLVAELDRALTEEEANTLSEVLQQEAIVQITNGDGRLYGPQAENWGPFNPEFFLTFSGKSLAETAGATLEQDGPTRGHLSTSAGLRGHSVGELYPLVVSGRGDGTWYVWNAETGKTLKSGLTIGEAYNEARRVRGVQNPLAQRARGQITLGRDLQASPSVITLFESANLSTFLHESGHFFLEVMADLAVRPNAPEQITNDLRTLLGWFGYEGSIDEWRALSISERREAHEQFARGFEAWLLEGNAPNQEMRKLFQRFRAWLINVYKSVRNLDVELTDEVRSVMANMLATEEQIREAQDARSYAPLFEEQNASGMTAEEWTRYQDNSALSTEAAQDQLQARSLRNLRLLDNARSKELRRLQKENAAKRAEIRDEVENEVAQIPVRVAETLILEGRAWVTDLNGETQEVQLEGPHKLSTAALEEAYGTREEHRALAEAAGLEDPSQARAPWQDLPRRLLAREGLTADEVAELVGMSSGDQLIRELLDMPQRDELIDSITDERMFERHGDLNNEVSMRRAVDVAVHNQHRTRVVTAELAALDASMKAQPGGIAAVRRAARDFAAKVVQRRRVRDLKPGQFTAAEQRAAREAQRALTTGDLRLAAARKRDQLFNSYASRDANKALDRVEKGLRYLKRFNNTSTRKNLDSGYRDQIDQLLERFDLRRRPLREVDRRTALNAWVKEQQEQGTEPVIPDALLDEARRTNYQNLTIEEFTGLIDAVKNIEHLARLKHRLLAAKDQRDFDQAAEELVTSIEDNAVGDVKDELERDLSLWGRFAATAHEWLTHLRKMASVGRQIDGGQDGGKFWSYLMRPINEASDREVAMRMAATKRLNELMDSVPGLNASFLSRIGQRVSGPAKLYIPEIGRSLSLDARLAVALNWGNEGNRQRITEGNQWTEGQVQAVIDTLTKQEMDFVQNVFDFIGEYWPEIAAKEERVTGVRPLRVAPQPITTPHGQYAGGYYPIVADAARSERAAQQNDAELISQSLRGAVSRATTRRGHTKARVGGTDPVRLDLGVITQHVGQVVHDLAWHEVLIDSGRLLRDKRIAGALRDHYGSEVTRLMRKTLDDVARGEVVARDAGERVVNHFRIGATIAGLGLSVTTTLLQPTGVTQSFVRIGYRHVAGGLLEFMARPRETIKRVREASTFMRDRGQVLNRELGEITNRLGANKSRMTTFYFLPIQAFQTAVDMPTWLGAYNKAVAQDETHERAVGLADQAVRDSQSSGHMHDLAEVQRGSPYKKILTNFYSYFSATYQLSAESVQGFKRDKSAVGAIKMGTDFLMLYAVPAALGLLIRDGLRGDLFDDDDEGLGEKFGRELASYVLGVFPFFRELGGAFAGFEYRGPAGLSFLAHSTSLIKQIEQGELDEPLLRAANRAAGTAFHYPAAQVDRTVRGLIEFAEGDAGPQAVLVGPPREEN